VEFNWSTVILEAINFIVLVWILKRFLYRPVMMAVERRRRAIQDNIADAAAIRHEAEGMREHYEGRQREWELEKEQRRADLAHELEQERKRMRVELVAQLEEERQRHAAEEERRLRERYRENEERALQHAGRFVARLLERLTGKELEARQVSLFIEELEALPEEQLEKLRTAFAEDTATLRVESAFPLGKAERTRVSGSLQKAVGGEATVEFAEAPELLAGLRVQVGYWVLDANLREEMKFFSEAANREP